MPPRLISSLSDLDVFAQEFVSRLKPNTILALSGPLGAGKTAFVQALAKALQVKETPVSPTFSLVRTYLIKQHPSIKKLIHVDAYRLEDEKDIVTLGLDDLLAETGALLCIEWPEQIQAWLHNQSNVALLAITPHADGHRTIEYTNASR